MAAVFKIDKNMQETTRFIKIIRYKIWKQISIGFNNFGWYIVSMRRFTSI